MAVAAPPPVIESLSRRLVADLRTERATARHLPPGRRDFSVSRTHQMAHDPLPILLDAYREFGPVFTIKILHMSAIYALGPEANHHITVSNAANFRWRDSSFADLIPLLGDGLLTTDDEFHRRSRQIMLPAFHRERIAASADTMLDETERALADWRVGELVDVYAWTRNLALRIALKALFGVDPERSRQEADMAEEFERALSFYGRDYVLRMIRGPRTPWNTLNEARRRLDRVIFAEIARRRELDDPGEDIVGLLMAARDEDGWRLSDQQLRDQVMTLLFAGHDTTTSTVSFLLYELARNPRELSLLLAEQDEVLGGRAPTAADLMRGLPRLDMALDEILRLYPPAWIGPRRAIDDFELLGHRIPGGVHVFYCSWASHRLPEVFPDPEAFVPERFAPEAKAKLAKGAYVPFGGGSRTCIGMRFGQLEVKAIATSLLRRFRLELLGGYQMSIRQMPTLSPRGGLPMTVRERNIPASLVGEHVQRIDQAAAAA